MRDSAAAQDHEDIAIVGMACIVPRADTPVQFWQNIVHKVDCLSDPPRDSLHDYYSRPDAPVSEPIYTGRGGYLGDMSRFNPIKYGIMPASIDGAEPDQFLALRCAQEALADAGVPNVPLNREKTAVMLGRGVYINRGVLSVLLHGFAIDQLIGVLHQLEPDRSDADLAVIRKELKRSLPPFTAETIPGLMHCSLTGRIANRLDLKGPSYTLDAACSSTLIAVEHGIRELRSGRCDAVLAGGVQVSTLLFVYQLFCHIDALSRTGLIAPFSAQAKGTMLGEGCGILVLKRRTDAENDGNRIYALIKAVGVSSDGKGAGLLAPRTEGQQLAIRRAYEQCQLPTSSIELIEAHGTGIPFGDKTEMVSLTACFGARDGTDATIALGSVKSNIGHLIPASGAASMIKTALALYHRTLPPTLHAEEPNPELGLEQTPFYLSTRLRPWIHGDKTCPRRAGINAFGFGGINAHAVLEEYPVADESPLERFEKEWPVELIVVSADGFDDLRDRVAKLASWLEQVEEVRLLDVGASCAANAGRCRVALLSPTVAELIKKLHHVDKLLAQGDRDRIQDRSGIFWHKQPLARTGRLAFVFSGAGAQYPHMLADLCRHFPEVRRQFDLTDEAYRRFGARKPLSRLIFPLPEEEHSAASELHQPPARMISVMVAERGLLALLQRLGIKPDAVVGHSNGEFVAFQAARAFDPADDEALIQSIIHGLDNDTRQATPGLVPPVMLTSVGGVNPETIAEIVAGSEGRLQVAIDNCPNQVVLAGDEDATRSALARLGNKGGLCERLPVLALHTPGFAPACAVTAEFFQHVKLGSPKIELWSCAVADRYPTEPNALMELAVRQLQCKLRFRETVQRMHDSGIRLFVEVGPRGNLSAFISDILGKQPHAAIALDVPRCPGLEQLCRAIGMLVAHGVEVNLPALYSSRNPRSLDLSANPPRATPREPLLDKSMPQLKLSESVAAQLRLPKESVGTHPGAHAKPAAMAEPHSSRARMLADYQQTMRAFLETQERVALAKFGGCMKRASPADGSNSRSDNGTPGNSAKAQLLETADNQRSPYLDTILLQESSRRLVAECELDLDRHRWLHDHTFFGRDLSINDSTLTALPVMPLALMLELMVETAAALRPDLTPAAVRSIQTMRWLSFETSSRRVRIEATLQDDHNYRVVLYEADREGMTAALAQAIVEMTTIAHELGPPTLPDDAVTPFPWPADSYYGRSQDDVYGRIVFHGPAFRGIVSLEAADPHAARASVREPDPNQLLPLGAQRALTLPVGLIDQCGQIAIFGLVRDSWNDQEVLLAFPNSIERVEFDSTANRKGLLRAVARMKLDGTNLRSDVEMINADGRVVLRALGRIEGIVRVPAQMYAYWSSPRHIHLSRSIAGLFEGIPGAQHCTFFETGFEGAKILVNRLWLQVLARMILSRAERTAFSGLKLPPVAAASWLLGRAVIKDAVRSRLEYSGCMADVEVQSDEHGKPTIKVAGADGPSVSAAHKGFVAVGVAGDPNKLEGVGIDLEMLTSQDAGLKTDAFGAVESEVIKSAAKQSNEPADWWYVAAWGAKEAVGKALGHGVLGGPRSIETTAIDPASGRLTMKLRGLMANAFPQNADRPIEAFRRLHDSHVVVLCLRPRMSGPD
jgi:acyl transferase domain-containing protein/phosphopantetheinyl transferase